VGLKAKPALNPRGNCSQ